MKLTAIMCYIIKLSIFKHCGHIDQNDRSSISLGDIILGKAGVDAELILPSSYPDLLSRLHNTKIMLDWQRTKGCETYQ